ncbi:flagellar basal-body rod protein FlgG [Lignipirellula cremea]|uniref:Flagellar basal-body rod protein FlgG n=1 Tax=Lignipirellula cremea TaxID=2528010 RepID=A0A518DR39_9BACT|nr:flagellar basal-body rod protein FlgG [Lignipirellula cremea]QDU94306.1 Flagellar basal-body rod protein FlgG [Lignipirellula cremea]
MTVQSLYTAATGMQSLETKLDVIANNLANINTTAFKKGRANFEDNFYRHEVLPGSEDQQGGRTAVGVSVGLGARVQSIQANFQQGAFQQTNRELDVAIEGPGFLQVVDNNGETVFTRAGNLSIDAQGRLVVGSAGIGRVVQPTITIPNDSVAIQIGTSGVVNVQQQGQTDLTQVGQLQLATFQNPEGLLRLGDNMFAQTQASAAPVTGNPGSVGLGLLRQNALEASNVEPVQELIDLITTQRSFELNSQAIQAGDQVLQLIANLRR